MAAAAAGGPQPPGPRPEGLALLGAHMEPQGLGRVASVAQHLQLRRHRAGSAMHRAGLGAFSKPGLGVQGGLGCGFHDNGVASVAQHLQLRRHRAWSAAHGSGPLAAAGAFKEGSGTFSKPGLRVQGDLGCRVQNEGVAAVPKHLQLRRHRLGSATHITWQLSEHSHAQCGREVQASTGTGTRFGSCCSMAKDRLPIASQARARESGKTRELCLCAVSQR